MCGTSNKIPIKIKRNSSSELRVPSLSLFGPFSSLSSPVMGQIDKREKMLEGDVNPGAAPSMSSSHSVFGSYILPSDQEPL